MIDNITAIAADLFGTPQDLNIILTHVNPDMDCVASATALAAILGPRNCIIYTQDNSFWQQCSWLLKMTMPALNFKKLSYRPVSGEHINVNRQIELLQTRIKDKLKDSGGKLRCTVWSLDAGNWSRHGATAPLVLELAASMSQDVESRIVIIDHHDTAIDENTPKDATLVVDPTSSSTCEMLWDLYKAFFIASKNIANEAQTAAIAAILTCGHLTDTGWLKWCKSPHAAAIMADLYEHAFQYIPTLQEHLAKNYTPDDAKAAGIILDNMAITNNLLYAVIPKSKMDGIPSKYFGGKTHLLTQIKPGPYSSCAVVILATETDDNTWRVEFRTVNDSMSIVGTTAKNLAVMYGGGGHTHAAGCMLRGMTFREMTDFMQNLSGVLDTGRTLQISRDQLIRAQQTHN